MGGVRGKEAPSDGSLLREGGRGARRARRERRQKPEERRQDRAESSGTTDERREKRKRAEKRERREDKEKPAPDDSRARALLVTQHPTAVLHTTRPQKQRRPAPRRCTRAMVKYSPRFSTNEMARMDSLKRSGATPKEILKSLKQARARQRSTACKHVVGGRYHVLCNPESHTPATGAVLSFVHTGVSPRVCLRGLLVLLLGFAVHAVPPRCLRPS